MMAITEETLTVTDNNQETTLQDPTFKQSNRAGHNATGQDKDQQPAKQKSAIQYYA